MHLQIRHAPCPPSPEYLSSSTATFSIISRQSSCMTQQYAVIWWDACCCLIADTICQLIKLKPVPRREEHQPTSKPELKRRSGTDTIAVICLWCFWWRWNQVTGIFPYKKVGTSSFTFWRVAASLTLFQCYFTEQTKELDQFCVKKLKMKLNE